MASSLLGRKNSGLHVRWGWGRGRPQLLLSEALSFLNGVQQLLFQLFVALVRWEIQTVETVERRNRTVSTESGPHGPAPAWPQGAVEWGGSKQFM